MSCRDFQSQRGRFSCSRMHGVSIWLDARWDVLQSAMCTWLLLRIADFVADLPHQHIFSRQRVVMFDMPGGFNSNCRWSLFLSGGFATCNCIYAIRGCGSESCDLYDRCQRNCLKQWRHHILRTVDHFERNNDRLLPTCIWKLL